MSKSTQLSTPPSSRLTGAGSVLNLFGSYYNYNIPSSPQEADRKALASDWEMVGQDMNYALKNMESELPPEIRAELARRVGLAQTKLGQTSNSLQKRSESQGQISALILGMACIIGSVFAAYTGHDAFASVLGGSTIFGLSANFIWGQYLQLQCRSEKSLDKSEKQ